MMGGGGKLPIINHRQSICPKGVFEKHFDENHPFYNVDTEIPNNVSDDRTRKKETLIKREETTKKPVDQHTDHRRTRRSALGAGQFFEN